MATVVGQTLGLDYAGRFQTALLETTTSSGNGESFLGRIGRHVRQLMRLRQLVRRTHSPIVHIHTCSGFSFYRATLDMLVAKQHGCRVVLHIHGAAFDVFHAQAGFPGRRMIAWSLERADRVIALSDGWRDKLRAMAPKAHVVVVENAVDAPAAVTGKDDDAPCHFLLLARMDVWKGIDDLLDACATLPADGLKFEVTLAGPAGSAGDAAELDRKIRSRSLEETVRYVGEVIGEGKADLLRMADAYVQPSHHEGMPIAILEAIAHGLPIVATRVGAVPEVITHGLEGQLVSPHAPDELARAMQELAANRQRRGAMSRAARELAESRFSVSRLRDDLVAVYDDLTTVRSGDESLDGAPHGGLSTASRAI